METLHFSIDIDASPGKIWEQLWGKESYTTWTTPFMEGSYLEGDLRQEGKVRFMAPGGKGMYSTVSVWEPNRKAVFIHQGEVKEGIDQPIDEKTKLWSGITEAYELASAGSSTHVAVSVDVNDDFKDFISSKFPEALKELKRISEQ